MVYLSGGKPKRPGVIKTLHVGLGPDFFSDIFQVETSDHARLQLQHATSGCFPVVARNAESGGQPAKKKKEK